MKLLYITNQISGPGGLERVLSIKASYFADTFKYEVHILTMNDTPDQLFFEFSPSIQIHNIRVPSNKFGYVKSYMAKINQTIKKVKPDLVLVCDDGLKGLLFPFLFRTSAPLIYERHVSKEVARGTGPNTVFNKLRTRMVYTLMKWGGKRFDAFVVLTKGNLKEWDLNNTHVIPNPLPFHKGDMANLENKVVIAVGKQSFQKGYDRLIQCWIEVQKHFPEWQLHIFGSKDPGKETEKQVERLQLSSTIKLFEPVRNIREKFTASSIHVLSSRYEGFGMVIIEAMACGLPSVSFDCPYGPSDIIDDGKNGFLIPNGDIDALAKALMDVMGDFKKRKEMGKYAFESVDRFAMPVIGKQWKNLFEQLVQNQQRS